VTLINGQLDSETQFCERWTAGFVNLDPECTFYAATFCADGVECHIHEWQNRLKQNVFYSSKAGKTTVKYQVCTQVDTGRIINVTGPCVGSSHDMTIMGASDIPLWMVKGEKMVLDQGYLGKTLESRALIGIKCPSTPEERMWNNLIASVRIDVERVISYFKRFRILRHTYIKKIELHGLVFHFLAHLINVRIQKLPIRRVPCMALRNATMKKPYVLRLRQETEINEALD
jgi:hypothetical protein